MYLNVPQRYILDLLGEYGCLKKSQLLFMVKADVADYLQNIDRMAAHLYRHREVDTLTLDGGGLLVMLPGAKPDWDVINAFDAVIECKNEVKSHKRGKPPSLITIDLSNGKGVANEINVLPVKPGAEKEAENYANENLSDDFYIAFFLISKKEQMAKIKPGCKHLFMLPEGGSVNFYENTT
jgi:hypothetical protein